MEPDDKKDKKKGRFSRAKLQVAKDYINPMSRGTMMRVGLALCVALLLYFGVDTIIGNEEFSSPGPVSSSHANFESECAKCHISFEKAEDKKCSFCHEKTNDRLGVYTFAAHYLYRSEDPGRIAAARMKDGDRELPCSSCHPDHRGRTGAITDVPDMRCTSCHQYGSFNDDHPQFEFARTGAPDDSTLLFTHVRHTRFVLEDLEKKTGTGYIEKACLYCHNPQPDGKSFKPLNFDLHCADCHLTSDTETPSLAIRDPANPGNPGVETLEMIQRRSGPGTMWAFYTNPNEFSIQGGARVRKSPVYHRDPWILENLRQLRQTLYGDVGLSDLLSAAGSRRTKSKRQLYEEAISKLQEFVLELRSRPDAESQTEVARIDSLLKVARKKVLDPATGLPDSLFLLNQGARNPGLTDSQRQDFEDFSRKLTKPCLVCHLVENAGIVPVKSSQRVLWRAEFDHRAHIVQRRCLDCHTEIPVEQALINRDTTGISRADRSLIQNIPKIDNCLKCHSASEASNTCVTCHFMHPNKENRGNLQLALDTQK